MKPVCIIYAAPTYVCLHSLNIYIYIYIPHYIYFYFRSLRILLTHITNNMSLHRISMSTTKAKSEFFLRC